jgi:hypothetical protein
LSAVTVAGVLAVVAQAQSLDLDYVTLSNLVNANPGGDNPSTTPTAASGGLIWIDTGGGPAAAEQDLNMEFLGSTAQNGPYVDLVSLGWARAANTPALFLLSNPSGTAQSAIGWNPPANYGPIAPGNPNGTNGYQGTFADPDGDNFGIPGVGGPEDSGSANWVEIRVWTGNFSTWDAALAGGALAGEVDFTAFFANSISLPSDMSGMPALVVKTVLPGDANLDGTVDINDLTVVLAHYGQTGMTWSQGEFTGDGTVDINDLTVVLAHYNQSVGAPAGLAAVPEPTTPLLSGIALVGPLAYAWRKRQSRPPHPMRQVQGVDFTFPSTAFTSYR